MAHPSSRRPPARPSFAPRVKVWLEAGDRYAFGYGIAEILQAVERSGTIKGAAHDLGKSYRHVWGRVKEAEEALGRQLVVTQVGGQEARRSSLTPEARRLVTSFLALHRRMGDLLAEEFSRAFS